MRAGISTGDSVGLQAGRSAPSALGYEIKTALHRGTEKRKEERLSEQASLQEEKGFSQVVVMEEY